MIAQRYNCQQSRYMSYEVIGEVSSFNWPLFEHEFRRLLGTF